VHYGTILSGNTVIKSKAKRDELRQLFDGIAVEMEAAGMMTRLPVAVIRGISDFADSSKDDKVATIRCDHGSSICQRGFAAPAVRACRGLETYVSH
jgi:nucleoside phosphorylase